MKRLIALREVELPSGNRVRGVLPSAVDLVRRGLLPQRLLEAVVEIERLEEGTPLTEDQRRISAERTYVTIAGFIRQEWDAETDTWQAVTYTPDEVSLFDDDDLVALEDIARRERTPEQVTAASRARRGEIPVDEAKAAIEAEAGETVDALESFRDEPGRPAPGDDGEALPEPAVRDARPRGSGRRARPRRGAGDQAFLGG